jgi:hypothetical protein
MSRVVVIYDDIVWAVGEAPKVECDAGHQGHCKTAAELRGGQGGQESGTWSSFYDRYGWLRIGLPKMKSSRHNVGAKRVYDS